MLRMYILPECVHCAQAQEYLKSRGVTPEVIIPNTDPIVGAGLAVAFPGVPAQFPILINFVNKTMSVGFKEESYAEIVAAVSGAGVHNGSPTQLQFTGQTAPVVQEPSPEAGRAAGL